MSRWWSCAPRGLALAMVMGCAPPMVLTELPNRPESDAVIVRGAERLGCGVTRAEGSTTGLLVRCPDGVLHVPRVPGPPTYAVRCVGGALRDRETCRRRVRALLLVGDR